MIMSDNGGEFVNAEFVEMCAVMNIGVRTSPVESPWCNGTVELHNGVLAEMIDAVLEDTRCNLDIAISCAINANVYGFSPHQLVFGNWKKFSEPSTEARRNNTTTTRLYDLPRTEDE